MLGFGITICIKLKNGKTLTFDGSGFEEAVTNFFQEWPSVAVSPKQLACASSVEELITLLTDHVIDGDRLIFAEPCPIESEVVEDTFDAYDFILLIREYVSDMADIAAISVELKEYNEMHFYRMYRYDVQTGAYTGIIQGTPEAAEDYIGDALDQSILFFSDLDECTIIERKDLYRDSDSDDAYYGFSGCTVT